MNKFQVKNSSELTSQSRDLAEISQWKVIQEIKSGYIIVAHISDNLTDPKSFATLICTLLNQNIRYKIPSLI